MAHRPVQTQRGAKGSAPLCLSGLIGISDDVKYMAAVAATGLKEKRDEQKKDKRSPVSGYIGSAF